MLAQGVSGATAASGDAAVSASAAVGLRCAGLRCAPVRPALCAELVRRLSCPADVCKSRMQNMQTGEFSGFADCATKLVKQEGVLALWKGYTPAVCSPALRPPACLRTDRSPRGRW